MDDSEIVAAVAAGDPAGLIATYDKYAAGLYDYCRWMLPESADAADALLTTCVAAATELGSLKEASEARTCLYAAARAECIRRVRAAQAAFDSGAEQAEPAARDRQLGRHRRSQNAPATPLQAEFPSLEYEVIELSIRHRLSEAELAALLDIPWQQAHALATPASGLAAVSPPLKNPPPEIRERLLRAAAVSAAARSGHRTAGRPGSARRAGFQQLGELVARRRIRANPGVTITVAALSAWVVAAASATLITVTGMHVAHALATRVHEGKPAPATPAVSGTVPPSPSPSPTPSSRPSTTRITAIPSPPRPTGPAPSPSATPSPSASPTPSPSASPTPSASPSSPSPSPSAS